MVSPLRGLVLDVHRDGGALPLPIGCKPFGLLTYSYQASRIHSDWRKKQPEGLAPISPGQRPGVGKPLRSQKPRRGATRVGVWQVGLGVLGGATNKEGLDEKDG